MMMSHECPPEVGLRLLTRSLLVLAVLGVQPSPAVEVVTGPTLIMDPNGLTPLAGVIELTTDVPARITLSVAGASTNHEIEVPDFSTIHSSPVLGFKPAGSYEIRVTVTDQNGDSLQVSDPLHVVTAPLPADFPVLTVLASEPQLMEPGFTLLDPFEREDGATQARYAMIVDRAGEVVWYATLSSAPLTRLPDATLLYPHGQNAVRIDMLGNVVENVPLQDPGGELHHDLYLSEHDSYLSLTRVTASVPDYPTSATDPFAPTQTADVEDNRVVEFSRTGTLLGDWSLMDLLDRTRIGYLSLSQHPFGLDWGHANSVVMDPADTAIVVSIRHQDAVVKFDPSSGGLRWILGPHDNWKPELIPFLLDPVGPVFEWSFAQHAAEITPNGNVILFDNGVFRASPFDGQQPTTEEIAYSRAVEYAVDEDAMEVTQVWEYSPQGDDRIYSPSRGDADRLQQTDNVLVTFSSIFYIGGVKSPVLGYGKRHVRIIEVDRGTPPRTVFDLRIHNPEPTAWIKIYRADRIPSLYADTTTVTCLRGCLDGMIFLDGFESGDVGNWF